jgi:carbonic anhydrase
MTTSPISPRDALARLHAGNQRFVNGTRCIEALTSPLRRHELVDGQQPFAAILTCSDSRVPVELVFDQGLGDLFVIRVAGNVVAPSLVGSIEYATEVLSCNLVLVMGHSRCGAVKATLDVARGRSSVPSANIGDIIERIRPSVEPMLRNGSHDHPDLLDDAIAANVDNSVNYLRTQSPLLAQRLRDETLAVIGATYDIGTGSVSFFEGVPSTPRVHTTAQRGVMSAPA